MIDSNFNFILFVFFSRAAKLFHKYKIQEIIDCLHISVAPPCSDEVIDGGYEQVDDDHSH